VPYRARPSFTVEVKRNNKRLPLTVTTADSDPREQHRAADQLLFGNRSTQTFTPEPQRLTAAEVVTPKPTIEIGRVQRPMGRILPDLLGETRAELQRHQELEEHAARLRAQRRARVVRPSFASTRTPTQATDEPNAGRETVLTPISTTQPLKLEEPVLAVLEVIESSAVEPVSPVSLSLVDSLPERTGRLRERRGRRAYQTRRRGSERHKASVPLRAGEKWKRRLPRVCW
jgi:hypothetical protein